MNQLRMGGNREVVVAMAGWRTCLSRGDRGSRPGIFCEQESESGDGRCSLRPAWMAGRRDRGCCTSGLPRGAPDQKTWRGPIRRGNV